MSILSDEVYNCIPVRGNMHIWPGMACLNNGKIRRIYSIDSKTQYQQWLYNTTLLLEEMELLDLSNIESWVDWVKKFLNIRKGMHFQISCEHVMYGLTSVHFMKRCYINVWKYGARKKTNKISLYSAAIEPKSDIAEETLKKLFGDSKKIEIEL